MASPSGTGHDTAEPRYRYPTEVVESVAADRPADRVTEAAPVRASDNLSQADPPVAVPGPASVSPAEPRELEPIDTRDAIDALVQLRGKVEDKQLVARTLGLLEGRIEFLLDVPEIAAAIARGAVVFADPVVSPADTIRRLLDVVQDFLRVEYPRGTGHPADAEAARLMAALIRARTAFPALLAVGERDKAEIDGLQAEVQRLADRAVCSGCGSDVGESGVCPYPDCDDGEMIPASDLPVALRNRCDSIQEDRAEWRSDWEGLRAEAKELERERERDRQHIAQLTAAVEGLLDVEERSRRGDPSLDPEEWFAIRDYASKLLKDAAVLADKEDAGA